MTGLEEIEEAYAQTRSATLAAWAEHEGCGEPISAGFSKELLGVAVGQRFNHEGWLSELHARAKQCAASDTAMDVVPRDCLHFTFLALAKSEFGSVDSLPLELSSAKEAYRSHVAALSFTMNRVRLLPLRNALVLAGVPDETSHRVRAEFASTLLGGPWSKHLRARYDGFEIPPTLWHTTLVRYESEFLPKAVRDLYHEFASQSIDRIVIGTPILAAVTYNWTRVSDL
ncbi:MAG: hypothetical protein HOG99_02815 [Gemmatimonadetes bacterium]|jgi:hypothetical protein|nr:hypothetical protein [Gemmatimonadota bacterium]